MKKKVLFGTAMLVFSVLVNAQQIRGGAGFFKMGYASLPGAASTFNKIAPGGITGFSNHFIAVGIEGYYRTNRVIIALDGNLGAQNDRTAGNAGAEAYFGAGYARFGWIIHEEKNHWIYPSVGSGTAMLAMTTYEKVNGETTNLRNKFLFSPSFDLGFNGDFVVTKVPEKSVFGGLLLGLRAGYRLSVAKNNWRDQDGNKLNNLPFYSIKGFYLMATIGGGGFVKR